MMRGAMIAAIACGVVASSMPAEARIGLNDAEIMAGALVVSGWTAKRHQSISLDGLYTTRSNKRRRFVFHVPYFPPGCAVTLKMGDETRHAVVANCSIGAKGEAGLAGPKGEPGPAGARGLAGPAGPQGAQGIAGPQGPQGVAGPQGPQGVAGSQGTPGPQGPKGDAGVAGPAGPKGDPGFALRQVSQACTNGKDCAVTCNDGEVALNAFCPGGAAKLTSARAVSCGSTNDKAMVAYCAK